MTTEIFKDQGWIILTHDFSFNLNYRYYSLHEGCSKSMMDWNHRKCYDCKVIVPDSIQTLIAFLVWES